MLHLIKQGRVTCSELGTVRPWEPLHRAGRIVVPEPLHAFAERNRPRHVRYIFWYMTEDAFTTSASHGSFDDQT